MTSIYQRALGRDFQKLHPQIQRRFGFSSEERVVAIGRGTMQRVWHGGAHLRPFLQLGATRHIMFPESGLEVPFQVRNYAYRDSFGRETVTWIREFRFSPMRRFDAYMVYSRKRNCIIDYLGTHQHLAVELQLSVDDRGGLRIRSGAQRFFEGLAGFRFPLLLSGVADVCEWFDDSRGCYAIDVAVRNRIFGPLFGYGGTFEVEWATVGHRQAPADVMPLREEFRE